MNGLNAIKPEEHTDVITIKPEEHTGAVTINEPDAIEHDELNDGELQKLVGQEADYMYHVFSQYPENDSHTLEMVKTEAANIPESFYDKYDERFKRLFPETCLRRRRSASPADDGISDLGELGHKRRRTIVGDSASEAVKDDDDATMSDYSEGTDEEEITECSGGRDGRFQVFYASTLTPASSKPRIESKEPGPRSQSEIIMANRQAALEAERVALNARLEAIAAEMAAIAAGTWTGPGVEISPTFNNPVENTVDRADCLAEGAPKRAKQDEHYRRQRDFRYISDRWGVDWIDKLTNSKSW
jgi:hypothetical protein